MSVGLGIRPELFESVIRDKPALAFLEAHSENYFGESVLTAKLHELREDYDISLHGVGLSLGRADKLDEDHLLNLKKLADDIEPILVSEHLAWSAYSHRHIPDLLPLPLNKQSLTIMCEHVDRMQSVLQRQVLVENPSNYLLFDELQIPEPEFLNFLAERTGCGLLVDVNNIQVSAHNVGRDPLAYIEGLNSASIGQYHLAGYTEVERGGEKVLIDTHDHSVYPEVWRLYRQALALHGTRPTLFEWDSDFPELSVLLAECDKAEKLSEEFSIEVKQARIGFPMEAASSHSLEDELVDSKATAQYQELFLDKLLDGRANSPHATNAHQHRLWIYQNNMAAATQDYLAEVYPAVRGVVGADYFRQIAHSFVKANPPSQGNIHLYGENFNWVVGEFEALQELFYVADLIRFEWALHQSYFCRGEEKLTLSELNQQQLLALPIKLNASVSIIESDFPLFEIHRQSLPSYRQNVAINLSQGGDNILVYKSNLAIKTHLLNDSELKFLSGLQNSENLLQAIEGASGSLSQEQVSAVLAWVLGSGLLCESSNVDDTAFSNT